MVLDVVFVPILTEVWPWEGPKLKIAKWSNWICFWKIQEISSLMSTETLYFYPKLLEIQRLKVGYPYHKILQLCIKIHQNKVELMSYYHNQMVPKGISECLLKWNLILSNPFFLGCIGKMLRLWVRHHFMEKKYFQECSLGSIF